MDAWRHGGMDAWRHASELAGRESAADRRVRGQTDAARASETPSDYHVAKWHAASAQDRDARASQTIERCQAKV